MRNLKRALSLALAAIMVTSVMIVGAGAASYDDFSDKDEIVNKEAVQMLVELGVINGKDTGDFDPTGIVTRAEMAKMICVVLNGGKDPSLGSTVTNSYTDTVGHWAAGYIEYCTQLGIVAGDGAGKFNPNATVTGSEAAKMLLVAMGYKSEVEGFTGANWAIGVNVRANQKGLYSDLSIAVDTGLSRDNAAQMIYNALDAGIVSYDYTLVTDGSTISSSPTLIDNNSKTLLEHAFNAVKVEGVVVANEYANLESTAEKGTALDAGETKLDVTNYGADEDQNVFGDGKYSVSTSMDMLGKTVTLYVKKDASSTAKATILGNAILSEDNVVVTTAAKKAISKIASDNDLDVTGAKVITNYTKAADYAKYTDNTVRGVEKVLIDNNNDGDVEYVLVNTWYFGKVSKYSTKDDGSITIDINDAWKENGKASDLAADDKADVVGFDDVAEGDYVLAAWIGGKLYVEQAESVTGVLDSVKKTETLTVDGTSYDMSQVAGYVGGDDDVKAPATYDEITNALDNEATFYLDKNGMVVAMGNVAENASNYAYVWASDVTGSGVDSDRVKVTLSDGTTKTYILASGSEKPNVTNAVTDSDDAAGRIFAYSINSDGEIKLSQARTTTKTDAQDAAFTKGKTTVKAIDSAATHTGSDAGKTTSYASTNTVFFYVSLEDGKVDSVDVYTGYTSAPTVTTAYGEAAFNSTGKMVAVSFTAASLKTTDVSDHLYVTDIVSQSSKTTTVKAILPGTDEEVEIKVDGTWTQTGLFLYSMDSDSVYTLSNATVDNDAVKNISSTTVATASNEYKLTDKTVWIELDDGDFDTASVGKLPSNSDKATVTTILANNDDEILMIVTNVAPTQTTPETPKGITVSIDGSNNIKVTWTGDSKPSNNDIVQAIRVKLAEVNSISDYTKVTGKTADSVKYTFTVDVNGMETTYPEFNMTNDVTQAKATTTAPTVTVAKSADKGATVTSVVGAGETGSITGYADTTADCVDITVSEAPTNVIYKTEVTGATVTTGNTYDLTGTGTNLVITVTASATGYADVVYTYTYTVA